ncbi:MAG TPA: glycosyltransferase, partial [Verrucomicrobiae bacterium]|nr:glycosyltransferase [Verrucomicrobiae bacterium]
MNFVFFYHSVLSDWNHGNAHFLRGVATELAARGHQVQIMEPGNSWSAQNLMADHGWEPFRKFHEKYPLLEATRYDPESLELDKVLDGADIVLVHEWTDPGLVGRIGDHHRLSGGY